MSNRRRRAKENPKQDKKGKDGAGQPEEPNLAEDPTEKLEDEEGDDAANGEEGDETE